MKTKFLIAIAVCFSLSSLTACNVSVTADDVDTATIADALEGTITETPVTDNLVPEEPIPETPVAEDVVENNEEPAVIESNSFSLQIIDQNKTVLLSVEDGDSVDLSSLPDFFNIEAATSDDFDNVQFEVSSTDFSLDRTERLPIWTMNPEDEGFAPEVGEYEITVTGYLENVATNVQSFTIQVTRSEAIEEEVVNTVVEDSIVDLSGIDASALENFYFSSVAEIDTYFHNKYTYGYAGLPLTNQEYYGEDFAYTQKNWLTFYIDMHKLTGDQKWVDYAEATIDFMFSRTDNKLYNRGELTGLPYHQAPQSVMEADIAGNQTGHIGWSRTYGQGRRVQILEDGGISKYIMKFVDYILANNITFDNNKLNGWIDSCVAIIKSHDSEFVVDRYAGDSSKITIAGAYYYTSFTNPASLYSPPVAFNHNANAASAMYLITKYRTEPDFTEKQHLIADFIISQFKEVGDHYSWYYGANQYGKALTGVLEDVNHSAWDIDFIADMYESGYIDESVMNRILQTVPVFLTKTTTAHYIDGSGSDDGGDRIEMYRDGYLLTSKELNSNVYNLILTNLFNYLNKSTGSMWHGKMAAAARIAYLTGLQ